VAALDKSAMYSKRSQEKYKTTPLRQLTALP
jgi:hypothetical protein